MHCIIIAIFPYCGNIAIFYHYGDNRVKSEHVYFVNGMLVLCLSLANKIDTRCPVSALKLFYIILNNLI